MKRPEDLQRMIHQCEVAVGQLEGSGAKALSLLKLLDEIDGLMQRLEEGGADLGPQKVRIQTLGGILHTKAGTLVKEMKAVGGLAQARQEANPDESHWWWYLDGVVAERRRQTTRRRLTIGGVVAVLIIAVAAAYLAFLAPSPEERQRYDHMAQADQLLSQDDLGGAVAEYEAARTVAPDEPDIHLWLGVLYEEQGRGDEATRAFTRAKELLGKELDFLVHRGMIYSQMGNVEATLADAEAALVLDPESAMPHFLLASAYEAQGKIPEAYEEFERAAKLAELSGNNALFVQARVRAGMLLQRPASPPQTTEGSD